jgi:hypothetical protein
MDFTKLLDNENRPIIRDPLSVPSMKCQSLLGKAIQEHFTKTKQIASVFASSPSLQNSSAGANFLTNFILGKDTLIKLFQSVFSPKECFSVQFSPALNLNADDYSDQSWRNVFTFFQNLINTTQYVEASLRSLKLRCKFINEKQMLFIVSNLKRLTHLELDLDENEKISAKSINTIAENLPELEHLKIECTNSVNTSTLQLFSSKLKKLKSLSLESCDGLNEDGIRVISEIESLTSISLCGTSLWNNLSSLATLRELTVDSTDFSNENLKQICSNCLLLRKLDLRDCKYLSNEGLQNLKFLQNLESLNLEGTAISDLGINHVCRAKNLTALNVSETFITEAGVENICASLEKLKKLQMFWCQHISDFAAMKHLKKLKKIEELNINAINVEERELHSFIMARRNQMKKLEHWSAYGRFANAILIDPFPKKLNWRAVYDEGIFVGDEDVALLFKLIGDEQLSKIEEIDLSNNYEGYMNGKQLTRASLRLISKKCLNLTKINLELCTGIYESDFHEFMEIMEARKKAARKQKAQAAAPLNEQQEIQPQIAKPMAPVRRAREVVKEAKNNNNNEKKKNSKEIKKEKKGKQAAKKKRKTAKKETKPEKKATKKKETKTKTKKPIKKQETKNNKKKTKSKK